ncbi:MAG: hypothetical protein OEO79_07270 [Gemmatimonadota bacterium]|nr:hypothetical protein [Gemmatimonadota bacterium]MDH3422583.1 hypothetical protein [Gemmatimonadota bacterium]
MAELPPTPELSSVVFQAVDAGTGSALSDDELTVRYLVRAPVTLDETSVQRVPSIEPYEIRHVIQVDALVLEVRLEADSYFRLDTVLSVPRGATAGPLTMRMSRRLNLVASEVSPPDPEPEPELGGRPAGGGRGSLPTTGATTDRRALLAGNQAFQRGSWLEATEAYARMPLPDDPASDYGREYSDALVRRGVAHMNRAEYGAALEVLEAAAGYGSPGFQTYLRLSGAQCAVGRTEEGRGTLAQLERGLNRRSQNDQLLIGALIRYERGLCSHAEFDRSQTTRERVRTGSRAITELQGFIDFGDRIEPVPPQVQPAIEDARNRIELIRRRMAGN